MRPVRQVLAFPVAVANSVALSQTTGAAGPLTLNGSLVVGGVAVLSATSAAQTQLTLTSAGNDSAVSFTITGTDYRAQTVTEVLVGPNANTVTSVNSYARVSSIVASAAVGVAITAGNAVTGSSPVVVLDQYNNPFQVSMSVTFTGAANVTVQYTNDNVFTAGSLDALTWFSVTALTAIAANNMASLVSPVTAARLLFNSGTGTVAFNVTQSGGTTGA